MSTHPRSSSMRTARCSTSIRWPRSPTRSRPARVRSCRALAGQAARIHVAPVADGGRRVPREDFDRVTAHALDYAVAALALPLPAGDRQRLLTPTARSRRFPRPCACWRRWRRGRAGSCPTARRRAGAARAGTGWMRSSTACCRWTRSASTSLRRGSTRSPRARCGCRRRRSVSFPRTAGMRSARGRSGSCRTGSIGPARRSIGTGRRRITCWRRWRSSAPRPLGQKRGSDSHRGQTRIWRSDRGRLALMLRSNLTLVDPHGISCPPFTSITWPVT